LDVRNLTGRWALVTGAGSGIGRASALAFAERGASLAICDLDPAGLEETAGRLRSVGSEVIAERVDVADANAVARFADVVHARVPAVDLLMNNAGVAIGAAFLDTPLEQWRWIVDINLMGVVHGCHSFVPQMVERGRGGHVVNVASAAGFAASQLLCAYSTTKFAVVGLSEALREELVPHEIGVTAICPGLIDTPITRAARMFGVADSEAMRTRLVEGYRRRGYGPERVAENVLRAVQRNRGVAPIAPEAWALYWLKRFTPGLLAWLSGKSSDRALAELRAPGDGADQ
jgi:NAD(P)-dependent dehydrogenase (short-subunit alcohol dehydrogenase family)